METRDQLRHGRRLLTQARTRRRAGPVLVACWLAVTGPARAAVAADEPQGGGNQGPTFAVIDTGIGVGVEAPGSAHDAGPAGASRTRCRLEADTGNHSGGAPAWEVDDPHADHDGGWFFLLCDEQITDVVWLGFATRPDGHPSAVTLAQHAWRFLPLPAPAVRTNPAAGTVVGLTTWFWTNPASLGTREVVVAVPGFAVTVRARAVATIWDHGDHTTRTCAEPSRAYQPGLPAGATGSCTHRYQRSSAAAPGGTYRGRASSMWHVEWVASDGSRGRLPDLRRSSNFVMPVGEVQTLIVPAR